MKRDFLKNLKVGDTALTDEIIDAIMAENGRDIENAKKPFADYDNLKEKLETAEAGLKAFDGVDVTQLKGQITQLQSDLQKKDADWQAKVDGMTFENSIKDAIGAAKGKNTKAIMALLDMDTLRASKDQTADIKAAIEKCQKENDYLFDSGETPPPFAAGTGTKVIEQDQLPAIKAAAGI